MKYFNIIGILLISIIISSCQTNEPNQDKDASYKNIKKTYELKEDGSVKYQYQHTLKYITHYSFNRLYGESFIVYNPLTQDLNVNKSVTTMTDGKKVASPDNAFNEVLPRFAQGAPAFNHLREMVVTHTGLEPGCMVDFDYEINSKANYYPYLNDNIILQERVPVENMEISIKVPENMNLNYKLVNSSIEPEVKTGKGFKTYTWQFKNLPALSQEHDQPHNKEHLKRLIFSTVTLKETIEGLYAGTNIQLSDKVKKTVSKRIKDIKNPVSIIRKIQEIAGSEINNFNIPIEHTSYKIRNLQDVWNSNGATALEKNLLFNELLNHAGFESKVILAIPAKLHDKNVGNLVNFGHAYILTYIEGEKMVLSCNPKQKNNLAYELKGNFIIDQDGKQVELPSVSETQNAFNATGEFELTQEGQLKGKINIKASGAKIPYISYLENPENAKEVVTSIIPAKMIKESKTIEFNNKTCEIEASIQCKEIWKEQGYYYFINIPASTLGLKGENISNLLNNRVTPLQLSGALDEAYKFTIKIPEGFSFIGPTIEEEINNEAGKVKFNIKTIDGKVEITKHLVVTNQQISVDNYSSFKSLTDIWNKKQYQEIILKKTE